MSDPSSPEARLQGACKQLRLAQEATTNEDAKAELRRARLRVNAALEELEVDVPVEVSGAVDISDALAHCSVCGTPGLAYRIHALACPHDAFEDVPERLAMEVKYDGSGDEIVYLTEEEVDSLSAFAWDTDATAVVVVRRYRDAAFYVYHVDSLEKTDSGNYRVTPEMTEAADAVLSDGDPDNLGSGHGRTADAVKRTGVLA